MRGLICCLSYRTVTCSVKLFVFLPIFICHMYCTHSTYIFHLISLQVSSFTHTYYGRSVSLGKVILFRCKIQVGGCCNIWDVTILSILSVILTTTTTDCHTVVFKFAIEYIRKEHFVGVSLHEHFYCTYNEVSLPEYLLIDILYQ